MSPLTLDPQSVLTADPAPVPTAVPGSEGGAGADGSEEAIRANEAIRAFLRARSSRPLRPEERVEYRRLLGVYLGAVRSEMSTAA